MPIYHDDSRGCRNSGMPLGGIGAGSVEIRPDGGFYKWFFMNNQPWGTARDTNMMEHEGLRFGAVFDMGDGPKCLAMCEYGQREMWGGFWFSDPYHLPWVRHAEEIHYRARLPFAELEYMFEDTPLQFNLTAWSPFIPNQPYDSNTPGAVLTFRVTNPTDRPCRLSLFGVMKNPVGYDHPDAWSHARYTTGAPTILQMTRHNMPSDATTAGTAALSAFAAGPHETSWAAHFPNGRYFWDVLAGNGRLENTDYGSLRGRAGNAGAEQILEGPKGTQRGALAVHLTIEPGRSAEVTFLLTWHFPHFRDYDHSACSCPSAVIGVQYANRFADAATVAGWLCRELPRLYSQTRLFADSFNRTTLPDWLLDAISASWSVLLRACWWDRAGQFGIWEGIGCCGLQTIDVGHYGSFPILAFFPQLDAAQNRLSAANLEPDGKVPHMMWGNFRCSDMAHRKQRKEKHDDRGRIDLGAQYVLAIWRHALWTGDLSQARQFWPVVENNLLLMGGQYDDNFDGLPDNQGPDQTYDQFPMYGTTAFVGYLFAAALRAAGQLADWLGIPDRAEHYSMCADKALQTLHKQLWNDKYFDLSCDVGKNIRNTGCMTDQLNGDWFFRQSSMAGLVDDSQVRSALESVWQHNRRCWGRLAWIANAAWPNGDGIEIRRSTSDQANSPWSGVEYSLASHMILVGMRDKGMQVARDVFERYENAGMRFDHIECGDYYYRCMSAWAIYQAHFGIAYDAMDLRLTVNPPGDATFLIALPSGYALARHSAAGRQMHIEILGGTITLREVVICSNPCRFDQMTFHAGQCWTFHY